MPTFTFECANCGRFDIHLPMASPNIDACPTCQGAVKKIFRPQRAIFKGGTPSSDYNPSFSFLDRDKLASGQVTAQDAMAEYKAKRWGENASPEQILGDFQRDLDDKDKKVRNLDAI